MAQPQQHIARTRAFITAATNAFEDLQAAGNEYTALGGSAGIKPFFFQADGVTPRTDLDITEAQYDAAMTVILGLGAAIGPANSSALYKVKG